MFKTAKRSARGFSEAASEKTRRRDQEKNRRKVLTKF
jgi:hypothetical protein